MNEIDPSGKKCEILNGIFYRDNKPHFFISGDYPYYRDDPKNWQDRLEKMKAGGIKVITFYIPWRHHFIRFSTTSPPKQICDFTGQTQGNRNVILFLKIIHELGLYACIKPGPFIHAETNYGGLPEFVNPMKNPKIIPQKNHMALMGYKHASYNRWNPYSGEVLPSPLDPEFLRLTKEYFSLIGDLILKDRIYPNGSILMLQFLNEGYFSAGRMPYSYSGDYSSHNIHLYQKFLNSEYGSIKCYNQAHGSQYTRFNEIFPPTIIRRFHLTKQKKNLQEIIDWNNYGVKYYSTLIKEMKNAIEISLKNTISFPPLIANWNPEGDFGQGLDVWATRVDVEKIKEQCNVNYGYTNWIGAVNYRYSSYLRYSFLCGRANGINMEENWGFAKLYDWQYRYGITSLFQSLLAIASGSTGYNIYTAVGTSDWDENIDSHHEKPYPSNSPINEIGHLTNKYFLMTGINKYFGEYFGEEFFECEQENLIAIGLYQPYIQLAAFMGSNPKKWKKLGWSNPPVFGMDLLGQFHISMRRLHLGYQIINLETEDFAKNSKDFGIKSNIDEILRKKKMPKMLIFVSSIMLGKSVQRKLISYINKGGFLYLLGQFPTLDENWESCTILKDFISSKSENIEKKLKYLKRKKGLFIQISKGGIIFQHGNPFQATRGPKHYLLSFLSQFLTRIRLKIPKMGILFGENLPFSEIMNVLGGDRNLPKLRKDTLKSLHFVLRFLQQKGIHRKIDLQFRTHYKDRRKVDVILYYHPRKDIQHIFLFSIRSTATLPISINYYIPEINRKVRISTNLVGHTAQLMRIENGKLTSFIYTGVNPISRIKESLKLKINNTEITTDYATDLIYLKNDQKEEIITAHGDKFQNNYFHGLERGHKLHIQPNGIRLIE